LKGGFFLRKKPLSIVPSVYTNPENAIAWWFSTTQNENEACRKMRREADPDEKIPLARPVEWPKLGEFTVPTGCP
jgi:hypothetical protein